MFDREKKKKKWDLYIFMSCLPPYNSNFRYFEIKPLVLRPLNLPDLTVQELFILMAQFGQITGQKRLAIILRILGEIQQAQSKHMICLFVCFVALRPKSTAMVIAGRSVYLTTLFPGQA